MMQRLLRGAGLVLVSVLITLAVGLAAVVMLGVQTEFPYAPETNVRDIAEKLTQTDGVYTLDAQLEASLSQNGCWAMLLDANGDVVFETGMPSTLARHYTAGDIAGFSRWFLADYPVSVWRCGDGALCVLAYPKGTVVKYSANYNAKYFDLLLWLLPVLFVVICAVNMLYARHAFAKEQGRRDMARSRWIDGVSHDIRTPISLIMGYAGQWTQDETLTAQHRTQAQRCVSACQSVKTLVSDLNLTMRLDYEMQPLRKEKAFAAALVRAAAAEAINNGMLDEVDADISPEDEKITLYADTVLLHRALMNLLQNAAYHGTGTVRMSLAQSGHKCVMSVVNSCQNADECAAQLNKKEAPPGPARDGQSAHGTGLHLVRLAAKAHGGSLVFTSENGNLCAALRCRADKR